MGERRFRHRTRWQIAMRYSTLGGADRAVGWALATWADTDGLTPEPPSLLELAEASGVEHKSSVARSLAILERTGWIFRARGAGGRGNRTTYQLTIPSAAEAAMETVLNGRTRRPFESGKGRTERQEIGQKGRTERPKGSQRPSRNHAALQPYKTMPSRSDVQVPIGTAAPWVAAGYSWIDFKQLPRPQRDEILARAIEPPKEATA